jgi:hypothetical protein
MIDLDAVRISARLRNIRRFQRLQRTELNETDLRFVRSHLVEEKASLAKLVKGHALSLLPPEDRCD